MSDILELPEPDRFYARRRSDGRVAIEGPTERVIGRPVQHRSRGERPDGVWAEWRWENDALTVRNDRYGYLPIYYVADAEEVCVSPSLIDVVRRTRRRNWNPAALGVFVRIGSFVGDETPFRDVRVLPPNAVLTWRPGGPKLQVAQIGIGSEDLRRDVAMDRFIELVRAAVRRRLPREGEVAWMPISGGRDSRHLLFELQLAGVSTRCLTTRYRPPGTSEDAELATAVCRASGADLEVIEAPRDLLAYELRKNLLIGFASVAHAWFIPMAEHMTAIGGVAYDGIAGDVLAAGHFVEPQLMADYEAGRYEAIARGWFDPARERLLSRLLSARARAAMPLEAAVQRVARELELYAGTPAPINAYAMAVRARRSVVVTQYGYLRRLAAVLSPYLDTEVFDFLRALPWQLFVDKQFHTDAIARAFPQYAHLPYAIKGASTSVGAPPEFRRLARQLLGYAALGGPTQLLSLPYLGALCLRSLVAGTGLSTLPILLMQLEREGGLAMD